MIYVFAESQDKKLKKSAFEVVSYAKTFGEEITAICIDTDDAALLKNYGADHIQVYSHEGLNLTQFNTIAHILAKVSGEELLVLSHSSLAASIAPLISVKKNADLLTNVMSAPVSTSPLKVKRKAFSGKGVMEVETSNKNLVLTVIQNAFGKREVESNATVTPVSEVEMQSENIEVESVEKTTGTLDLKEAERVVSAGRGLKGPENWGMIEDLAQTLGAATACSKPVSDLGWRPHSEHVGQTGKAIAPDLYIAIGISGAIQHLAGVSGSKKIVVVNIDPEAPFFAAADYGVVGDAFEVIPALTEKLKAFKS